MVMEKLNLIFISIDTLRRDHLSCYGYRKNTTPNIDKMLANKGVVFLEHFAPSNCTLPGYTTMFTGLHPISHDIISHNNQWPLQEGVLMLAEILKKNRYNTAQVSTLITMSNKIEHLKRGFDKWEFDSVKYNKYLREDTLYQGGHSTPASRINAQALDYLEEYSKIYETTKQPFYLFIHYWDPHFPYQPPVEFEKFYDKPEHEKCNPNNKYLAQFFSCPSGKWILEFALKDKRYKNVTDPDYIESLYDGEIAYADHHIGILLNRLKELGLEQNTIIVLTSDHGETMSETNNYIMGTRCMFSHVGLTEPNISVPFIIRAPEIPKCQIKGMTQHIDILPTLLELLNLAKRNGKKLSFENLIPYYFDGVSLVPNILGDRDFIPASACELGINSDNPEDFESCNERKALLLLEHTYQTYRAIRTKRFKFIKKVNGIIPNESMPNEILYDLLKDPNEYMNLAYPMKNVCKIFNEIIEKWVKKLCEKFKKTDPQIKYPTTLTIWNSYFEYDFINKNANSKFLLEDVIEL